MGGGSTFIPVFFFTNCLKMAGLILIHFIFNLKGHVPTMAYNIENWYWTILGQYEQNTVFYRTNASS